MELEEEEEVTRAQGTGERRKRTWLPGCSARTMMREDWRSRGAYGGNRTCREGMSAAAGKRDAVGRGQSVWHP